MALYPFKFRSRLVQKIWGGRKLETVLAKPLPAGDLIGESWELYDFPPGVVDKSTDWVSAEITNGPLAGRSLHWAVGEFGRDLYGDVGLSGEHGQFPILIKYLDAKDDLSLQVHPDQAYADTHADAHLKSEAWYVLQSEPGAAIYKGLAAGTTREQFEASIRHGSVMDHVQRIPVKPGHCHYLPSGTVHALGKGILVAEVQTPSDTTFRVFDFNRIEESTGKPRALHVEQSLACIDFSHTPEPPQPRGHVASFFTTVSRLVTSPYFKLEKVRFTAGIEEAIPYDQPVVWMMLEGEAELGVDDVKESTHLAKGDTVLLPAVMKNPKLKTMTDCIWLEVTFPLGIDLPE